MFIGWVIFITILSLFSLSELDLDKGNLNIPYADKMTHFVFYTGFAILCSMVFRERTKGMINIGKATRNAVILAIGYGMLIEALQYVLPTGRMAEWGDVLANSLGALTGIGLIRWLFSKEKPLKWKF